MQLHVPNSFSASKSSCDQLVSFMHEQLKRRDVLESEGCIREFSLSQFRPADKCYVLSVDALAQALAIQRVDTGWDYLVRQPPSSLTQEAVVSRQKSRLFSSGRIQDVYLETGLQELQLVYARLSGVVEGSFLPYKQVFN